MEESRLARLRSAFRKKCRVEPARGTNIEGWLSGLKQQFAKLHIDDSWCTGSNLRPFCIIFYLRFIFLPFIQPLYDK